MGAICTGSPWFKRVCVRGLNRRRSPLRRRYQTVKGRPMSHASLSTFQSRREWLRRMGGGFGALGLAGVVAQEMDVVARSARAAGAAPLRPASGNPLAPLPTHFPARATRVIFLFMNGGPSHVDTFDPKPTLRKHDGAPAPASLTMKTGRKNGAKLMASPF